MPSLALSPQEWRRQRWALALWCAFLVAVVVATARRSPQRQSVITHYRTASHAWLEARPLYGEGREHGFLYLPTFAVLHVPFASLPFEHGAALWRVTNLALLGVGVWRLSRALAGERAGSFFLLASLLSVGWSSARHGQATLAMAGALLAACGALSERRFAQAAAWLAFSLALKPLSLAPLLVAAVAWRPLLPRLLGALAVVALLPFLAQAPGYVADQWADFFRMLSSADAPSDGERFIDVLHAYASLGSDPPRWVALGLRAGAGLATLLAFLWLRRRADERVSALLLYALGAGYLLAFNPRTEHNTYALVVPALGAGMAWAILAGRTRWAALHAVLGAWIWVDHDLTSRLPGGPWVWTKPCLLVAAMTTLLLHARRARWRLDVD